MNDMTKRVFIVFGWDGYPEVGWFPWLKKELEAAGFHVFVPHLPDSETPRIEPWVTKLAEAVGISDEETYFVGHSMGCQAIARYLATLPENMKVGGGVFVARFFQRLTGLEDTPDVRETERHWLNTPIDLATVRTHLRKSIAIFPTMIRTYRLKTKMIFENNSVQRLLSNIGGDISARQTA